MSDHLPAWSLPLEAREQLAPRAPWPDVVTREWAWGGSTGAGVRVCVVDSGIDGSHPAIGAVAQSVVASASEDGSILVKPSEDEDVAGHGTACAGIVRALAPDCELHSIRVLGATARGNGRVLVGGLRWAIEQGFDVVNLSLSTTKRELTGALHELVDAAYFRGTLLVASAHNMPVESYPWRFAALVSVGSHDLTDPWAFYLNPQPPVEFFARGVDVEAPWPGGATLRVSGNSFATPHLTALCALIRSKHPDLTPFEIKTVLALTASNAT